MTTRSREYGLRTLARWAFSPVRWAFGALCALIALAAVAAVPIANLFALGWLIQAEGRVARTGSLRGTLPRLERAGHWGGAVIASWLFILPVRWLFDAATDASIIDPGSHATRTVHELAWIALVLCGVHTSLSLLRGGRVGMFVSPRQNIVWAIATLRRGAIVQRMKEAAIAVFRFLDVGERLRLGLIAFACSFAYLVVPTALFSAGEAPGGGAVLLRLIGGIGLAFVMSWLPLLQAHFAASGSLSAFAEVNRARALRDRAPFAWLFAVTSVFVLTFPLYLLKVALPPRDAMAFITIVFVASIFPARLITGWAYHRTTQRTGRAAWPWRWSASGLGVFVLCLWVFLMFFTPFIGAEGKAVLFEHHAFLLPH